MRRKHQLSFSRIADAKKCHKHSKIIRTKGNSGRGHGFLILLYARHTQHHSHTPAITKYTIRSFVIKMDVHILCIIELGVYRQTHTHTPHLGTRHTVLSRHHQSNGRNAIFRPIQSDPTDSTGHHLTHTHTHTHT